MYAFCAYLVVGTRVGTLPENGFKMQIFGSDFRKSFPVENNEKRPKCVKIKHLGRFTMAEKEGFEELDFLLKNTYLLSKFSGV